MRVRITCKSCGKTSTTDISDEDFSRVMIEADFKMKQAQKKMYCSCSINFPLHFVVENKP